MNCDQAFDEMTRADGIRSPELEQHMAACPRCREMYDVLSPALVGLQSENRSLTRTVESIALKPQAIRVVSTSGEDLGAAPRFLIRTHKSRQLWLKAFAFFCAGAAVLLAALLLRQPNPPDPAPVVGASRDECNWVHRELAEGDSPRSVALTCIACHMPPQR